MPFCLNGAQSFVARDATEADIHRAFDDDWARGEFIILEGPGGGCIQAAGEYDEPYQLNYVEAGESFDAEVLLTKAEVREAFLQYMRGDPTWRESRRWKRFVPMNPWLRAGIIALALVLAAGWLWWCWSRLV